MKLFGYKPPLTAWVGLAIIAIFIFVAIFADFIAPYGEAESVGQTWDDPSFANWLGTDNIGRDLLSRLIFFQGFDTDDDYQSHLKTGEHLNLHHS